MGRKTRALIYGLAAVSLLAMGCAGTKPAPVVQEVPKVDEAAEEAARLAAERARAEAEAAAARARAESERDAQLRAAEAALKAARELSPVYFDFDKYNIRDDQRPTLSEHATKLNAAPSVTLILEGHCDERGTVEYNLALGQRRAEAVRAHLVRLGVSAERLDVVSFGEERPADPGHSEGAWARNRRVEFTPNS